MLTWCYCFPSCLQTTVQGQWALPKGLLTADVLHTFTVTVYKESAPGSTPLTASASLSLRPRSTAVPFPRGSLTRQCGLAGCKAPHGTDRPLTVAMVLDADYTAATVSWSSDEVPSVSSLTATDSTTDPSIPAGTHYLTIPASLLPTNLPSISIAVNLALNDQAGFATVSIPLNTAPTCSLSPADDPTDASPCLTLNVRNDTFPSAVVTALVQGWSDAQDDSQLLRYEFGVRTAFMDVVQQIGSSATATIVGLPQGTVKLYACALDSQGSRTCATATVTVQPPPAGFDASAVLQSVNVSAIAEVRPFKLYLSLFVRPPLALP